jgi:hypothetical protein
VLERTRSKTLVCLMRLAVRACGLVLVAPLRLVAVILSSFGFVAGSPVAALIASKKRRRH